MNWIIDKLTIIPGIIIGLSLHEYGHAKVAQLCGDRTAESQGRVSVNPLAHIDWLGMITLLAFGFGWGKPVMINPRNFKHPRRDCIFVGLAGVFMNFITAILFAIILRLLYQFAPSLILSNFGGAVNSIIIQTIIINLSLMLFNLLPVPPLDGFGVLSELINLPKLCMPLYIFLRKYGQIILIVLLIINAPSRILSAPLTKIYYWILNLAFTGL